MCTQICTQNLQFSFSITLSTNNGLEIAEKVYLADDYKPILPLEKMIPEQSMPEPTSLNYISNARQYNRLEDNDVKIDIGRWCEEYVFNYLKSQNIYSTVEWMNQEKEAFLPYDFIVRDNQSEQFIEVKGTPSNSKSEFYMSKNE